MSGSSRLALAVPRTKTGRDKASVWQDACQQGTLLTITTSRTQSKNSRNQKINQMWLWNVIWYCLATIQWCPLHSASDMKGSLFSPQKARKMHFIMLVTGKFKESWCINDTSQKFNQWLLQPWDGNAAIIISSYAFYLGLFFGFVGFFVWDFFVWLGVFCLFVFLPFYQKTAICTSLVSKRRILHSITTSPLFYKVQVYDESTSDCTILITKAV